MGRLWATLAVTCLLTISRPRPLAAETDLSDWIREKMGYIFNILGPFDPAVKSPCFHSQLDGSFACLPYYHILGAPKSGTTDIYARLTALPQFVSRRKKEPGFFYRPNLSFKGYLNYFAKVAEAVKENPKAVSGDGSTMTFTIALHKAWDNPRTPGQSLLPQLLKLMQPEVKLMVILRDPVERLHSAYYYYGCKHNHTRLARTRTQNGNYSPENFHEWAQENLRPMEACLQGGKSARECSRRDFHGPSYHLMIGMYVVAAREWLQVYAPEQIKFVNFDASYRRNETGTILDIVRFLDVDMPSPDELKAAIEVEANRGVEDKEFLEATADWSRLRGCDGERRPMLPETRRMLQEFYAAFNAELAELLGDASYLWLSPS